jgi:hypothetical protein
MSQQVSELFLVFILFVVLTPGIVLTLPPPPVNNRFLVAVVHAIVYTLLFYLGTKYIVKIKTN